MMTITLHSSFNSRIAAKHPVKHFVIIKRGGVVTGPQTVPKVYVGHVFHVPINYISLGMVRATGFFGITSLCCKQWCLVF